MSHSGSRSIDRSDVSHGFARIDRAFRKAASSPFAKVRQKGCYDAWFHLAQFATYMPMNGLGVGEIEISCRELAEEARLKSTVCYRALLWLTRRGMIEVVRRSPRLLIRVPHYHLLPKMELFMEAVDGPKAVVTDLNTRRQAAPTEVHQPPEMVAGDEIWGTVRAQANILNIRKYSASENSLGNSSTFWGTVRGTAGESVTTCNGREKMEKKPAAKPFGEQFDPILKNYNKNTTTLKSSSRRLAHKRKPHRQPTDEEIQLATFWHETITKHSEINLVSLEDQIAGIVKVVDTTKIALPLLKNLLTWAADNWYWRQEVMCTSSLLAAYRREKGVKRIQRMLADMNTGKQFAAKADADNRPNVVVRNGGVIKSSSGMTIVLGGQDIDD